ncbi:GDP-mannose 4,6-dehydratase [Candidatus Woesearchaeota archaeon]|nr:GDP-mannose 4,6-dehydratase [Candidatus Woesearchaeota archaeon]
MRTALVTGGTGFLGSHLCEHLLNKEFFVICIDNNSTSNQHNVQHLMQNPRFKLIQQDITLPIKTQENAEIAFHLASPASPIDQKRMQVQTLLANATGTKNVLEYCRQHNTKFLFASTCEIYGDPLVCPQNEEYYGNVNPVGERSCYDEAKRFGEALTMAYNRAHGINTKIARIFHAYGAGMRTDDSRVVPSFITKALKNQTLTINGDGNQQRSLCYATDIINGITLLMEANETMPVNIGNPEMISIKELANKIIHLSQSKSTIEYKQLPINDPKAKCPDITKAKKILGWEPKTSIDKGLKQTIEYFKQLITRENE